MKTNLVLIGLPGCGKTTIGALLSQHLGYPFLDIDAEIEARTQQKISQLFEVGEAYFRDIETKVTKAVAKESSAVISTGGGVVLRPENMAALRENGHILFIKRSLEDITGDIDIESRPLLREGVERLKKLYAERIHLYEQYADVIIENDQSLENTINQITKFLHGELKRGAANEN